MAKLDARKSGSFKIGGEIEVHRLAFGAMRITGPRIWGPPLDRAEAIHTLKRLPELGIDFIDTADSYGPEVSEQLIREVLYPYDGILIATKAGLRRPVLVSGRETAGILAPTGYQEPRAARA
jgi:pyridoxine 4-dehydrogenase